MDTPYLKGLLGEAAASASWHDTFLGQRYPSLVQRRGKMRALVAVSRSIPVIVCELLYDPAARSQNLGYDHYATTVNTPDAPETTSTHSRHSATR